MDQKSRTPRLRGRFGWQEFVILASVLLLVGATWIFIEIAEDVVEGETHAFDQEILLAMREPGNISDPLGPKWVEELGRDFTALGGVGILTLITFIVAGYLAFQNKYRIAVFLIAAIVSGILVSFLLKRGFDRPRPDLVPHESYVYTTSFPSGHSMMSAVTYLTLAALLARVQNRIRLKIYFLTIAVALILVVGASRVYMGVHWPTDVLAGWTAGTSWTLLCWLLANWLQRRGQIEEEEEQ